MSEDFLTAEEYESWVPVPTAYECLGLAFGYDGHGKARQEFWNRLVLGHLHSASRTSTWEHENSQVETRNFERISPTLLQAGGILSYDDSIWTSATKTFIVKKRHITLATICHGIRFDPFTFRQIFTDAGMAYPLTDLAGSVKDQKPVSNKTNLKTLPVTDMRKAAKLIHEIWGMNITEKKAAAMTQALFPDHNVPRDPFLVEYRPIRGVKNPGKQASTDKS